MRSLSVISAGCRRKCAARRRGVLGGWRNMAILLLIYAEVANPPGLLKTMETASSLVIVSGAGSATCSTEIELTQCRSCVLDLSTADALKKVWPRWEPQLLQQASAFFFDPRRPTWLRVPV